MSITLRIYAQFTKGGAGITPSSSPTVDVYQIARSNNAVTHIVTGAAATALIANGVYFYALTGADLTANEYLAVFSTTDNTVDLQQVPALQQANAVTDGLTAVNGYASGQDPASLVLDVAASGHNTAGTIGAKINSGASAGDPWATAEPGSYASGTFGYFVTHTLAQSSAGLGFTTVTQSAGGSARNPSDMTCELLSGQPVMGVVVQAYLASAYAANPATATVVAETTSNVAGGWTLNLPTGAAYTLVFVYSSLLSNTGSVTV